MTIWRAGMLAVCIADFREPAYDTGRALPFNAPRKGGILRILGVHFNGKDAWLIFEGIDPECAFDARGFRPLNDAEDDAALIARIKACQPRRAPAPGVREAAPVASHIHGCSPRPALVAMGCAERGEDGSVSHERLATAGANGPSAGYLRGVSPCFDLAQREVVA